MSTIRIGKLNHQISEQSQDKTKGTLDARLGGADLCWKPECKIATRATSCDDLQSPLVAVAVLGGRARLDNAGCGVALVGRSVALVGGTVSAGNAIAVSVVLVTLVGGTVAVSGSVSVSTCEAIAISIALVALVA